MLLRQRAFDAVIPVFEGAALPLALLRRLARFRPRLILWDLTLDSHWRIRERLQDFVIPRLDAVLVLGRNQVPLVRERWPGPHVEAIGHGIDTGFWHPRPAPVEDYVLAVGDDGSRDYATLLEAASAAGLPVVLRSARPPPPRWPVGPMLRWLPERCSYPALRELYARAAIVAVPLHDSAHAGGVTAVLEAAAMGRPMVVSDSAGVRDWAIDGETCLRVPCNDSRALAAALRTLTNDAALRERIGAGARAFAETHGAPAVFAARFAACLRRLCA